MGLFFVRRGYFFARSRSLRLLRYCSIAGAPSSAAVLWSWGIGLASYTAVTIMSLLFPVPSPLNPTNRISVAPAFAWFPGKNIVTALTPPPNLVASTRYSRSPVRSSARSNRCVGVFLAALSRSMSPSARSAQILTALGARPPGSAPDDEAAELDVRREGDAEDELGVVVVAPERIAREGVAALVPGAQHARGRGVVLRVLRGHAGVVDVAVEGGAAAVLPAAVVVVRAHVPARGVRHREGAAERERRGGGWRVALF